MVQIEEMFMIKDLRGKGIYSNDIAKLTGRDPKTIIKEALNLSLHPSWTFKGALSF